MANLFQRKTAVIEYRPALINGAYEWYWSVLPLPDETHAVAHGSASNRGTAAMQARQQARKNGYGIGGVRIKHNFAESARRRIHSVLESRQKRKPIRETGPDDIDPKAALSALPARYWLVSIEAVQAEEVIDYYVIAFDKEDAVERLRKRGVIRPEPEDYVAAVIEVPKSDYDQFLKWQDEFGVYESKKPDPDDVNPLDYLKDQVRGTRPKWFHPKNKLPPGFKVTVTPTRIYGGGHHLWYVGTVWKDGQYVDQTPSAFEFKDDARKAGIKRALDHAGYQAESVSSEAAKAEEPSEAQAEAGNYKMGHISLFGLDISIENAKGSTRSGKGKDGKEWSVTMPAHYGYIKGTTGKDKDHIDVYIGPDEDSEKVYVVNQQHKEGGFDEHKCMICFSDRDKAISTYDKAFTGDLGPKLRQSVVSTTMEKFKEWLESGDPKKQFKEISESADPDAINPKQYLQSTLRTVPSTLEVPNEEAAYELARQDYAEALGKTFTVNEVIGYDLDHGTDVYAKGEFTVRVIETGEDTVLNLAGEGYIDPHWNVEVISGDPSGMEQLKETDHHYIYGRSFHLSHFDLPNFEESLDPDAVDPRDYLNQAFDSKFPGFTTKKALHGEGVWFVHDNKDVKGAPDDPAIGRIFYIPAHYMARNTGEARWGAEPYDVNRYFDDGSDAKVLFTFDDAVRYIINIYKSQPMRESADPDNVDPKAYLAKLPKAKRCVYCNSTNVTKPSGNGYIYCNNCGISFHKNQTPKSIRESDPDDVDPRAYLNRAFPTRGTVKDFAWALDSAGVRAVGIRKKEDGWHIHGHYFGKLRTARKAIDQVLTQFHIQNFPWTLEPEGPHDQTTRMFYTIIPQHLLDGGGAQDQMFPPGYMIRT